VADGRRGGPRASVGAPGAAGAPRVPVMLSNGKTIVAQKYRCVARLGGRPLRGSGKGGCTFKLPENAKGKRLRVSLVVTYGGITDELDPSVFKVR